MRIFKCGSLTQGVLCPFSVIIAVRATRPKTERESKWTAEHATTPESQRILHLLPEIIIIRLWNTSS